MFAVVARTATPTEAPYDEPAAPADPVRITDADGPAAMPNGHRAINAFVNEHGIPYVRDTMSVYVETAASRFDPSNSGMPARMNMFRYGPYYYETRSMGQDFGASRVVDESTEPYDLIAENKSFGGLNISACKDTANSTLKAPLKSSEGSYISFNKAMTLPISATKGPGSNTSLFGSGLFLLNFVKKRSA